jgi:hypothetical protein
MHGFVYDFGVGRGLEWVDRGFTGIIFLELSEIASDLRLPET